jgi:glycosyltransferase involved in cell wall biosynthesis
MRIAVNTRLLLKDKLEGIGWFTYETVKRITQNHPEHEFLFLFDRKPHPDFLFSENVTPYILHPQARHPFLWYIWFEFSVARFLKKHKVDLFLSPDGMIPLNSNIPVISVIHDINFLHYPKGIPFFTRSYFLRYFPLFARKSTHIVTVSHYSKIDIATNYNINPDKITVAYNGANTAFKPYENIKKAEVRNRFTKGKPYFIFVGALNPRKNVARLIMAFDKFIATTELDYALLIVGEPMFMTSDIKDALNSISSKDSVIFTGRMNVDDLTMVMASATALTYVPYFEGFGIPLVEAMNCHTPIIASDRTSIPEVAGDAAFYVDPFDVDSIAYAMKLVATDNRLQEALSAKAESRKKLFSWDATANGVYQCIENVMKNS